MSHEEENKKEPASVQDGSHATEIEEQLPKSTVELVDVDFEEASNSQSGLGWDYAISGVYVQGNLSEKPLRAHIGHIESPSLFYVMAKWRPEYEKLFEQLQDMAKILHLEKINPMPDLPVMARYSADNNWYRAILIDYQESSDNCRLFFIDYGNTETVPLKDLLPLPLALADLPCLACQCTLSETSDFSKYQLDRFMSDFKEGNEIIVQPIYKLDGADAWMVACFDPQNGRHITGRYVEPPFVIPYDDLNLSDVDDEETFFEELDQDIICVLYVTNKY